MEWNDDSYADIIVGDRNGYVNYFQRNPDGTLTTGPKVPCAGDIIVVGSNSAPVCTDWDEDGDTDLLVGNETGNIRLYINDGGESVPVFSTYSLITSSGTAISHYRCCPQVFDLNNDGNKDLLVGGDDAYIHYYENTGTNAAPEFSGQVLIQSAGAALHEYYGIRLWVDDWDANGTPDIITSDYNGFVRFYPENSTGIEEEAEGVQSQGLSFSVQGSPGNGLFVSMIGLSEASNVELDFFSIDGRLAGSMSEGLLAAGEHSIQTDLTHLPSGVYVAVCSAGGTSASSKMVITR